MPAGSDIVFCFPPPFLLLSFSSCLSYVLLYLFILDFFRQLHHDNHPSQRRRIFVTTYDAIVTLIYVIIHTLPMLPMLATNTLYLP